MVSVTGDLGELFEVHNAESNDGQGGLRSYESPVFAARVQSYFANLSV